MAPKWISTKFPGIRYREHANRVHGKQKDRYFNARFQVDGQSVNEGYGWASEGMSAAKAAVLAAELKEELRTGKGTGKLSSRRKALKEAEKLATAKETEKQKKTVTYQEYFEKLYSSEIKWKKSTTAAREISLHRYWILPTIGQVHIHSVTEFHIKKVKHTMEKAGKAPRTVQYAYACMRMVLTHSENMGYHPGPNPVKKLKPSDKPKFDNRRVRFFSHAEADRLLVALKTRSIDVHDMTLLSLHCGLRAGEIFQLSWRDIDLVHSLVTVRETKSGRDRVINITREVAGMLKRRNTDGKDLVFPDKKGRQRMMMSKTFMRVVEVLGFNDGCKDRKQKCTFHTCRHTCASWLVLVGVPLFTVQKILGHSTIAMTERYAHLAPEGTKTAFALMEESLNNSRKYQEMIK